MKARKITDKQLRQLASWEKFLEVQLGTYPSTVAAIKLGMTTTGVYNAAERGHLTFFQIGRDRWYELSLSFRHKSSSDEALKLLVQPNFVQATPEKKFDLLSKRLSALETSEQSFGPSKAPSGVAATRNSLAWSKFVKINETQKARTLSFSKSAAPGFAEFVEMRLEALFVEFQEKTGD